MKFFTAILLVLFPFAAFTQTYPITGKVKDETDMVLRGIEVHIKGDKDSAKVTTGKDGIFTSKPLPQGTYYINISIHGFDPINDTVRINDAPVMAGVFTLTYTTHSLDEVKIVQKVLAMVQKDDTVEFNSAAYKVNPDADAADLVKKMPGINVNGKTVTAQGEAVTKIVVDGKPFFGSDPYAALKNLPADVIDKVQVYNEKSDQEQFTGFSEGPTTKTVNIITKPNKRNGIFGKIYGGAGTSTAPGTPGDNSTDVMYGAGLSINQFEGDKRITLTGQSNNVNIQNFSDESAAGSGGAGLSTTHAGGINYSDKWSKKIDLSCSYFFNEMNNSSIHDIRKTYLISTDSGQIYNENSPSSNRNYGHRFNMRLNYNIDSMNSLLEQPQLSFRKTNTNALRIGNTYEGGDTLNRTNNVNLGNSSSVNFSNNLLYRHKFRKKGRTFSLSLNASNSGNDGTTTHTAQNEFYNSPALNDTINQQTLQNQSTWNLNGDVTYTEPLSKSSMLKLEYDIAYTPAGSNRNTYDFVPASNAYTHFDTLYSNDFNSRNTAHKAGLSYQLHTTAIEASVGLNYQLTELSDTQQQPIHFHLNEDFQNLLPNASLHYRISKTKNLQCNYSTSTQVPSVSQLQNVVNNTDPLHLYAGNPYLKQPYRHSLIIRYNATSKEGKNNFSASLTGALTQHNITSNSIIAARDTLIEQHYTLAQGSQFTMPENIEGNRSLNANLSYGLPLSFIKCRLNLALNGNLGRVPAVINSQVNIQNNRNGGVSASLASNISENVDFTISAMLNISSNDNSINTATNNTYLNAGTNATLNIIFWKGFVFNTTANYQSNSGAASGFNQDYVIWNMSLGKKIFKNHKGDIRIAAFDLLNQNNSLQHTVTDFYIQDTRTNILQRYFLLVFSYKLNEFRPAAKAEGK